MQIVLRVALMFSCILMIWALSPLLSKVIGCSLDSAVVASAILTLILSKEY
jgi:hypothetical protein